MALDIGIHLLGNPMGFYEQEHEVRADLVAYWRLMNRRGERLRYASHGPARLGDLAVHSLDGGTRDMVAGMRAWLGSQGVKFKSDEAPTISRAERQMHIGNARRCGASKRAVSFWLGS